MKGLRKPAVVCWPKQFWSPGEDVWGCCSKNTQKSEQWAMQALTGSNNLPEMDHQECNRRCNDKCPGIVWRRKIPKGLQIGYPSLLSNCSGTTLMQQSDFEWSKNCVLVNHSYWSLQTLCLYVIVGRAWASNALQIYYFSWHTAGLMPNRVSS